MIWGPFLLAVALGLIVSAGLYFAYLWPQVEPADDDDAPSPAPSPEVTPAPGEPTEAETEAPAPASESSPA